ncbi:MAG: ribosome biogenesis factor YjgA [bacterium]
MVDKPPLDERPRHLIPGLDDDDDDEPNERAIRRRAKRAVVDDRVVLAERLVALRDEALALLPIPADVEPELALARRLKASGAKKRQIRFVARLLTDRDGPILAAERGEEGHLGGLATQWLDHLLQGEDAAIDTLIATCPEADRQRVRQLVRQAHRSAASDRAADRLLAYLQELAPPAPPEGPADQDV